MLLGVISRERACMASRNCCQVVRPRSGCTPVTSMQPTMPSLVGVRLRVRVRVRARVRVRVRVRLRAKG